MYMLIDATAISKQLPSAADMQGWCWRGCIHSGECAKSAVGGSCIVEPLCACSCLAGQHKCDNLFLQRGAAPHQLTTFAAVLCPAFAASHHYHHHNPTHYNHTRSSLQQTAAPWWAWIGGVLGAYYVIVNISFAYKLGAGTAVSVFVCSQLGCSIVLDLAGLVGFQKRAFSW